MRRLDIPRQAFCVSTGFHAHDKSRLLLLNVEAAKLRFNALKRVKESTARQSKSRNKKSAQKKDPAAVDAAELGLVDAWVKAAQDLTFARLSQAALFRKAKEVPKSDMRVAEAERQIEEAKAVYHPLLLSLRPDTPQLTYHRVDTSNHTTAGRVRKVRDDDNVSDAKMKMLQAEKAHLQLLRKSMREASTTSRPSQTSPPPVLLPPAQPSALVGSPESITIEALLHDDEALTLPI